MAMKPTDLSSYVEGWVTCLVALFVSWLILNRLTPGAFIGSAFALMVVVCVILGWRRWR